MDTKWVYKMGIHFAHTKLHHFVPILDFRIQKYVQNGLGYKMGIQNGHTFCTYKIASFCTHFGFCMSKICTKWLQNGYTKWVHTKLHHFVHILDT